MPTSKPRITITLEPAAYETLTRLAAASGDSMSKIVAGYVELAMPALGRLADLLERARSAPDEVRRGLLAAVERAERELMPGAMAVKEQAEELFQGLAEGIPGGSTPVAVTRGSGHPFADPNGGDDGSL